MAIEVVFYLSQMFYCSCIDQINVPFFDTCFTGEVGWVFPNKKNPKNYLGEVYLGFLCN